MKYYFDECTSDRLVRFLRELGAEPPLIPKDLEILHVGECSMHGLSRGMPDISWMPIVAAQNWIAVTVDNNIRRRKEERRVRAEAKLRVVYLHEDFAEMKRREQAVFLLTAWPNIVARTLTARAGECFIVQKNHAVKGAETK